MGVCCLSWTSVYAVKTAFCVCVYVLFCNGSRDSFKKLNLCGGNQTLFLSVWKIMNKDWFRQHQLLVLHFWNALFVVSFELYQSTRAFFHFPCVHAKSTMWFMFEVECVWSTLCWINSVTVTLLKDYLLNCCIFIVCPYFLPVSVFTFSTGFETGDFLWLSVVLSVGKQNVYPLNQLWSNIIVQVQKHLF